MDFFWSHGPGSSEACREALAASRPDEGFHDPDRIAAP